MEGTAPQHVWALGDKDPVLGSEESKCIASH